MFPLNIEIQLEDGDVAILRKYCATINKPNCYLEIGTYKGGSALIAKTATSQPIYTIDILDRCEFKNYDLDINFIIGTVIDWDEPIGVLFIDGNHNKALEDFNAWEKYVVRGGYILFHDYIETDNDRIVTVKDDIEPILKDKRFKVISKPNTNERILVLQKI